VTGTMSVTRMVRMLCLRCHATHSDSWMRCPRCGVVGDRAPMPVASGTRTSRAVTLATAFAVVVVLTVAIGPYIAQARATPTGSSGNVGNLGTAGPVQYPPQTELPQPTYQTPTQPPPDPQAQAQILAQLLTDMQTSRQTLSGALADIGSCTNLAAADATVHTVVSQRADQLRQADALSVDALPGGTDLKAALTAALEASQNADAAYARWADTIQASSCRGRAPSTADQREGDQYSQTATQQKATVVADWNAIASQFGLSGLQNDQI
jgi:hypothetical protein